MREIWILTGSLNGEVVTYPGLGGFNHTLLHCSIATHCLNFTYITYFIHFTRTLHILLISHVHYIFYSLHKCTLHILPFSHVHYIFYSHFSFNALTLFFHLPYLCHHSINLKFTSLPNKHHACFSYILYLHFLHLTLPKHIN